ncbi:hypothetical protein [Chryseobacterium sp. Marseille-Q8038]
MPVSNLPAFFKGNNKEKPGCTYAGVEPDNLAGVTGFAIPPMIALR